MEVNSVTELLALRLSAVPFHDIEPHDGGGGLGSSGVQQHQQDITTETPTEETRPVPQLTSVSFIGPVLLPSSSTGHPYNTRLPLLAHPASPFLLPLLLLPTTLVVGNLPQHNNHTLTGPDNHHQWLISGEICIMSGQLAIVAQSIYAQTASNQWGSASSVAGGLTSQVSFTGYISTIVPGAHAGWIHQHHQSRNTRSGSGTLEEALEVAKDAEQWESAEVCSRVQVSLADIEWLEVCVEVGVKPPHPPYSHWVQSPPSHLVAFKSRPSSSENNSHHPASSRVIHYATSCPLVGQLITIESIDDTFNFFIQL